MKKKHVYGTVPIAAKSLGFERKPHASGKQVVVLVDSRASGNFSTDQRIPELKHRRLDRVG